MSSIADNHVLMIVNPISGGGGRDHLVALTADRLRANGLHVDVLHTSASRDATRFAEQSPPNTKAVIAVGGDGTVREVAEGLLDRSIPLVALPLGTENLLARHFKMKADAAHIVETVLGGRLTKLDVGVINDRHFLIMAGVGFDAEVVARLTAVRRGHVSHLSYIRPLLHTFWAYDYPAIRVEIDGQTVFHDRGMAFAGVLPCYGAGLKIVRDALGDDGLLDLCILPCASRMRWIRHAAWALRGRHIGRGGVIYMRGKEIRIESQRHVAVQVDGDAFGRLPVEIRLRPQALSLLIPGGGPQ